MFGKTLFGLFLAALSVIGFASTFLFGARLTKDCGVSAEVLAFLRFAIAGVVMLVTGSLTAHGRRRLLAPTRTDWKAFLWLGPVGTTIMAWCVFMGCARVSTANASMADALTPMMIFSVGALRVRRIERRELVGLLLGFLGVLFVVQIITSDGLHLSAYTTGDVFILLSAATWGVYTVYGRERIARLGSQVFTTWTMLVGLLALGLLLPFLSPTWPTTARAWTLVLLLGLVSTLLPFWTWNAAQKYLPMSVLGISAYFTPVVAVSLASVFLGERATVLQWLGTIFVIAAAATETSRTRSDGGIRSTASIMKGSKERFSTRSKHGIGPVVPRRGGPSPLRLNQSFGISVCSPMLSLSTVLLNDIAAEAKSVPNNRKEVVDSGQDRASQQTA